MEKKMSTVIIIAAIAVVVAACASVLGILAMSQAKSLEARVAALESSAMTGGSLPSQSGDAYIPPIAEAPTSDKLQLTLGEWSWENGNLLLHSGYARADVSEEELSTASLDLRVNGTALEGCLLHMNAGEASGTVACELQELTFPLEGEELDGVIELTLTVELKNGETLTTSMGGWSYEGGSLMLISG